jgi:ribose transport system ATP-binding protein
MAFADDCSIFRNGRHVESFSKGSKSGDEIVNLMIGRDYKDVYPEKPLHARWETPILEVVNLNWGTRLARINLHVRKGEVLGLGGLDGQGQRELLLALFGVLRGVDARIKIDGMTRRIKSPRDAKRRSAGMALIPEDRQTEGLVSPLSVRDNISLAAIHRFARSGFIRARAEAEAVEDAFRTLSIHAGGPDVPVATLSGGNQQKVVIAKWLFRNAKIFLFDEPTRGIDVGAKAEVFEVMDSLAKSGAAVLMVSSEMPELLQVADRILVMRQGRISGELPKGTTQQEIMRRATLAAQPEENVP